MHIERLYTEANAVARYRTKVETRFLHPLREVGKFKVFGIQCFIGVQINRAAVFHRKRKTHVGRSQGVDIEVRAAAGNNSWIGEKSVAKYCSILCPDTFTGNRYTYECDDLDVAQVCELVTHPHKCFNCACAQPGMHIHVRANRGCSGEYELYCSLTGPIGDLVDVEFWEVRDPGGDRAHEITLGVREQICG